MDDTGIAGIYLAAGKSVRMGRDKLNLPLGNACLGSFGFWAALSSKLNVTIAVTRPEVPPAWLAPFLNEKKWRRLECTEAEKGQSESLKTGVRCAEEMGAKAVVILLADQPFVHREMINRLIVEFEENPNLLFVAFKHEGLLKPPVLLSKKMFPEIFRLEGDQGARALIRSYMGKGVPIMDDHYFYDVDCKEDYERIAKEAQRRNASI